MSNKEQNTAFELQPRAGGKALSRWMYEEIRAAIIEGRLPPASKIPSRRELAHKYGVALGTVAVACAQLVKQGYLEGRVGSGTFVSAVFADRLPQRPASRAREPTQLPRRVLSPRGRLLATQPFPKLWSNRFAATFQLHRSPPDIFPLETWNRMVAQRPRLNARDFMAHGEPLGYPPLRAAIAGYINRTRAVRCKAGQVVVTSGTQQSLDLVARLLLDRGDEFWMEDPGYAPVTSLLRSHGAKVIGVPVDAQGLDCDAGRRRCRLARLAYVTPHCQFPLGIPMSHERRLKLLQWANEAGAWIFEDDYDGDLPFENTPVAALHSLDRASCVIYSSSFNRLLFPSLRLGFMILPAAFVEPAAAAISISQRYYPVMEQATLAHFILEGHWDMHIRRMRELYQERREALVGAARSELGGLMRLSDSQAGSQVIGWLAPGMSEAEAYRRAAANGIDSIALSRLTIERRMPPGLVLGIGGADIRAIRTGIKHLGRVLRALAWQQGIRATSA